MIDVLLLTAAFFGDHSFLARASRVSTEFASSVHTSFHLQEKFTALKDLFGKNSCNSISTCRDLLRGNTNVITFFISINRM